MPINSEQNLLIKKSTMKKHSKQTPMTEFDYDNGFDNKFFKVLFETTILLMSVFWEHLDKAICEFVPTTDYYKFHTSEQKQWYNVIFTVIFNLLVVGIFGLPLLVLAFPFWLVLDRCRARCYRQVKRRENSGRNRADSEKQENEKLTVSGSDKFTVVSNNLCFLTEIGSRVNNLSNNGKRARKIGDIIMENGNNDASGENSDSETPDSRIQLKLPENIDFLCLQEVFQRRSAKNLISKIKNKFPHIIWDIGHLFGENCGKSRGFISLENSGLLLASKHPILKVVYKQYREAAMGDRAAGKGVLLCVVDFNGSLGIIATTHLQAQEGEVCQKIRRRQMKFVYGEIEELKGVVEVEKIGQTFEDSGNRRSAPDNGAESNAASDSDSSETVRAVRFVVICGDFNFDISLKRDKIETESFDDEFSKYQDCHSGFDLPSSFDVATPGMHKLKNSKQFECCLRDKKMWKEYFYVFNGESEEVNGEKDPNDENKEKPIEAIQLDHIWFHSETDSLQLLESYYHTSLCGFTDHIPISASFRVTK